MYLFFCPSVNLSAMPQIFRLFWSSFHKCLVDNSLSTPQTHNTAGICLHNPIRDGLGAFIMIMAATLSAGARAQSCSCCLDQHQHLLHLHLTRSWTHFFVPAPPPSTWSILPDVIDLLLLMILISINNKCQERTGLHIMFPCSTYQDQCCNARQRIKALCAYLINTARPSLTTNYEGHTFRTFIHKQISLDPFNISSGCRQFHCCCRNYIKANCASCDDH